MSKDKKEKNTAEAKDTKVKKDKAGVRTKNVFGKPLGKTNLIIILAVALVIVGLSYWLVTSTVQKDIDKYNKDTSTLTSQINSLKRQTKEELIDTSLFMSALPESINPEEVRNEISNAARSVGINVLAPNLPISYTADANMPTSLEGLSKSVKCYYFGVSIAANDVDTILAFVEKLYSTGGVSSRVYYVDSLNIVGMNSETMSVSFVIYTFYRPAA